MSRRVIEKRVFIFLLLCFSAFPLVAQEKHEDTEKLGMALEYFTSGKYHEALMLFQQLDSQYKLNVRFRAYIGLCHYYEWQYEEAAKYLDETIPQLSSLAPHERSVYYYAAAESHFNLQEYEAAIPYYEQTLTVCYQREKGDAYYRLGFCYMFLNQWANARDSFRSSEIYYGHFRKTEDVEARMAQLTKMIKGCDKELGESDLYIGPDSTATDSICADSLSRHDEVEVDSLTIHTRIGETQWEQILHGTDDVDAVSPE